MVNDWWDVRFMGRYWEGGGILRAVMIIIIIY